MKKVDFSIITVCYNSVNTIKNTFESLLVQTYKNFEYIVIDGGSTDGTIDIIREYENKFKDNGIDFIWKSESDRGIYDAMNKGIDIASGEIVGILNSDDIYNSDALYNVYINWKDKPQYDVYHGLLRYVSNNKTIMIRGTNSEMLYKNMIEHPACFVKLKVYKEIGTFNCKYKFIADYEFLLRVKQSGYKFLLLDFIVGEFDENGAGNSFYSRYELIKFKKDNKMIGHVKFIMSLIRLYIREVNSRLIKR